MKQYTSSFLYLFLTAVSLIFIHIAGVVLSPLWILFLGSLIAIVYFHLINLKQVCLMYRQAWQHKGRWFMVMLIIAIMWPCSFYGPQISPDVYILLYFATSAVLGLIVSAFKAKKMQTSYLLAGLGLLLSVLLLLRLFFATQLHLSYLHAGILLLTGVVGGLSSYLYKRQSYLFSQATRLLPTQVLALRFWLLVIVCGILLPKIALSQLLNRHQLLMILFIAITSLILPIYFNQRAIMDVGPERNAIICGYAPLLTYVLSLLLLKTMFHPGVLAAYIISGVCMGWPFLHALRNKPRT